MSKAKTVVNKKNTKQAEQSKQSKKEQAEQVEKVKQAKQARQTSSKKAEAVEPAPAEEQQEGGEKKPRRTFKMLIHNDKTGEATTIGRYVGATPKQAAAKGFSKHINKLKKAGKKLPKGKIDIYLRESTQGRHKKIYAYSAERVPIDEVKLELTDKKTGLSKTIKYNYRNQIHKIKVPDTIINAKITSEKKRAEEEVAEVPQKKVVKSNGSKTKAQKTKNAAPAAKSRKNTK